MLVTYSLSNVNVLVDGVVKPKLARDARRRVALLPAGASAGG